MGNVGSAISAFASGDVLEGGEQLLCGGVFGGLMPHCSKVDTIQWLEGIAEMVGGGVLGTLGVIDLGESILSGGSSVGLALGIIMVGGGGFALVDGYLRSSKEDYSFKETINLAKGVGEGAAGGFLFVKGAQSLFEVYNGSQFSYFELGVTAVGLGGGSYLGYMSYKDIRKALGIRDEITLTEEEQKEVIEASTGVANKLGDKIAKIDKERKKKTEENKKTIETAIVQFQEKVIGGSLIDRMKKNQTGGEKSINQVPAGKRK